MMYFPIVMIIILSIITGGNIVSSYQNTKIIPTPTTETLYPTENPPTDFPTPTNIPTETPTPTIASTPILSPTVNPTAAYLINQMNNLDSEISDLEKAKNELKLLNIPPSNKYPSRLKAPTSSYKYDPYRYIPPTAIPTTIIDVYGNASRYTQYGNTVYGSDGSKYSKYGNTIYGNDGSRYSNYGNTTYGNNGSRYTQYENTMYGNDGSRYSKYGDTTYGNDGSSCTRYGNSTYCRGVY